MTAPRLVAACSSGQPRIPRGFTIHVHLRADLSGTRLRGSRAPPPLRKGGAGGVPGRRTGTAISTELLKFPENPPYLFICAQISISPMNRNVKPRNTSGAALSRNRSRKSHGLNTEETQIKDQNERTRKRPASPAAKPQIPRESSILAHLRAFLSLAHPSFHGLLWNALSGAVRPSPVEQVSNLLAPYLIMSINLRIPQIPRESSILDHLRARITPTDRWHSGLDFYGLPARAHRTRLRLAAKQSAVRDRSPSSRKASAPGRTHGAYAPGSPTFIIPCRRRFRQSELVTIWKQAAPNF